MEQNIPTQLIVNLGQTIHQRLQYVAVIKNAMAAAIMLQVENDMVSNEPDSPFVVYQTLYMEAHYVETLLQKA